MGRCARRVNIHIYSILMENASPAVLISSMTANKSSEQSVLITAKRVWVSISAFNAQGRSCLRMGFVFRAKMALSLTQSRRNAVLVRETALNAKMVILAITADIILFLTQLRKHVLVLQNNF